MFTKTWIWFRKHKNEAIHEWFGRLPGSVGIGNVRYTTSGKCDDASLIQGTQPVTASENGIKLALSFNGNIVNTSPLKKEMSENFSRLPLQLRLRHSLPQTAPWTQTGQRLAECGSISHGKP